MGGLLAYLVISIGCQKPLPEPFLFPILPSFREIGGMNPSDKTKAFFTYATAGSAAIHVLADHLSDENAKDANFSTSVLGFTRTPIRQDLIRIATTLSDPAHLNDVGSMRLSPRPIPTRLTRISSFMMRRRF